MKLPHWGQARLNVGRLKARIDGDGIEDNQTENVQHIDNPTHHGHSFQLLPLRYTVGHHHQCGEEDHFMDASAFVRDIEAHTVVGPREINVEQVYPSQPSVVMTDDRVC